jgi:hypothetical protein
MLQSKDGIIKKFLIEVYLDSETYYAWCSHNVRSNENATGKGALVLNTVKLLSTAGSQMGVQFTSWLPISCLACKLSDARYETSRN